MHWFREAQNFSKLPFKSTNHVHSLTHDVKVRRHDANQSSEVASKWTVPFGIGFIWKSIRESIKERALFWMIQFPRLRVKPHRSPTWLWMTNPICTPPCAFNTQRSSKLKIWLSSPVLLHLKLIFCFVMTFLRWLPPHPIIPICSSHCLPFPAFSSLTLSSFFYQYSSSRTFGQYWLWSGLVNWKTVRGL